MARAINSEDDESLVVNAADPAQVGSAAFADDDRQAQALHDVRAVMSTRAGRRAVRRWLGSHGLYKSITAIESTALTYALSGRRDAGLEMLEDLVKADGTFFLTMEDEHRQDEARLLREAAARRATRVDTDVDDVA
jgi:hypothetical protein